MNVADKAREALSKVRPGSLEAKRTLPIRAEADQIERGWAENRDAVLDGIPVAEASIACGSPVRDWGTAVTLELRLESPLPGIAAQALAGKAVRRLKALVETGEIPTTAHNPSARADAGEEAS